MSPTTWNQIKGTLSAALGVVSTTYQLAVLQKLIDLNARWGQLSQLAATVLMAYGFYGAYTYQRGREPWSEERRRQESVARIARGEPPLVGFEHLLVPGASAPPSTSAPTVPTSPVPPPAPPMPPPPPREG